MKIALVLVLLVVAAAAVYRYRETVSGWLPGLKTYIVNGLGLVATVAAPVLDYLGKINFEELMTKQNAFIAGLVIFTLGILLSVVTRRAQP